MDGLDGTGLQLDGLDWFKTFIGDQKLKKILYRQLEKVIFPAVTMRRILKKGHKKNIICNATSMVSSMYTTTTDDAKSDR